MSAIQPIAAAEHAGQQENTAMSEGAADRYAKWRRMLAGERVDIHDEPEPGFWRGTEGKESKLLVGIATWPDEEGRIFAMRGRRVVPVEWVWPFCTKHPISEAAYRAWEATGEWTDIDAAITAPAAPGIGHNEPPDEAETLRDQIESATAGAADYAKIGDDETCARAQSLRSRLLELSREADKKREAEKKPHLEKGKAADAKWQPLVKAAKEVADAIAKAMGAYETAKARAAAEAQRKAEEERRRQEEAGRPAPALVEPDPSPPPATQIRGGYGRAASVRVVKVATVVDQDKVYGFLRTHPELVDMIARLAQRAVDKGHDVPGVTVEDERRVA